MSTHKTASNLANLLRQQDQQKGDLSIRAEGICQTIAVLAETKSLEEIERQLLAEAIIACFVQYRQSEVIGKGESAKQWPTNRFALSALAALGFQRPSQKAAA